jgi:hypothetical protein
MHPDEPARLPAYAVDLREGTVLPLTLDDQSFRLALVAETWLTKTDWCDAMWAGIVPPIGNLALLDGEIFARRPGGGLAHRRWYRVTPAQALDGVWPLRLGPCFGEDCEHAAAWLVKRDSRLPVIGENDAWTMTGTTYPSTKPVRYVMPENAPTAPSEPAPMTWRHPLALVGWCLFGVALISALAVVCR